MNADKIVEELKRIHMQNLTSNDVLQVFAYSTEFTGIVAQYGPYFTIYTVSEKVNR